MNIHRTIVTVIAIQLVLVLGSSALAAPKVDASVTTTSSDLKISAEGSPLKGSGTFKYGKDKYVLTVTDGYTSPDGNAAHLTGTVPVQGAPVPFSFVCNRTTGYLEIHFGSVKFWSKGNVTITK
ncbi:MAG: hypothetical protein K8T25_03270 [Planctomycetia bacterium]|nr:hypothetical protein [Planctomycetia bacterium]